MTNLTEDATYYWTVIPSDGREDGFCIDNVWEFGVSLYNVLPNTKLEFPENSAYVGVSPELYWTVEDPDAGEIIKYYIYLSDDYKKVEAHDGSVLYRNRGFFDNYLRITPNLQSDTLYYWTVIPEDNVAKGSCTSGIWSFTTSIEGYTNSLPKVNLLSPNNGVTLGETEVELRWNGIDDDEDDVLKYMVYFSTNKEMVQKYDFTALFDTVTDITSIKISYLQNDTVYYWAVIPYDGKNNGLCLDGSRNFKIDITKEPDGPLTNVTNVESDNNFEDLMIYIILAIIVLVVVILVGAVVLRKGGKKRRSKEKKEERVEIEKDEEEPSVEEPSIEEPSVDEPESTKPEPPSVILPEPTVAVTPVASTLSSEFPLQQAYRPPAELPKPTMVAKTVHKPAPTPKPIKPSVEKPKSTVIATRVPKIQTSTLATEYPLVQKYSPPPEQKVVPKPSVVAPKPKLNPKLQPK